MAEVKITDVDSMKYRKHTHIAGVDVEELTAKGKLIVTIKTAYFGKGVNINGKNNDAYFIEFVEELKPMCVNSGNRKILNNIVKNQKGLSSLESRNLTNWVGVKFELYFEPNRVFAGVKTGGIGIKEIQILSDLNGLSILEKSKSIDELKSNWELLTGEEKKLPSILAKKEQLKNTFTNEKS